MDIDVIAISIDAAVEDERRVHEAAWVNQLALFSDLHFLDVEYEASVEDLLGQS